MKILMLTHEFPPFLGGISTYASKLAQAAHLLGHEITVVAPNFGKDCGSSDLEEYPYDIIRYRSGPYRFNKLPAVLWRTWRWSASNGFDIVHAVDVAYVLALAFLAKFKNISFVATAYGTDVLSMPSSKQARWLNVSNMFEQPEQIYAISLFTRQLILRCCPLVDQNKVQVAPLGVSPHWFEPADSSSSTIKQLRVPTNNKIIITVSRLDERKGHRTVLKAITRLDDQLKKSLTYIIVGKINNNSYYQELKRLSGECGVRVHFVGMIAEDELHSLYSESDIFCMPGEEHSDKVEGFGLVYLEAGAHKVPSIASRLGGVPEVVLHNKTGLLIEPGDDKALSGALTRLLTDKEYCRKLGETAHKHASTFTWQRCAELTYGQSD